MQLKLAQSHFTKFLIGAVIATSLQLSPIFNSAAQAARGPESVADVTEQVIDSVVNISTTQTIEPQARGGGIPDFPQGTPFDDLFEEFFKRFPQQQGGQGGKPQKATSLGSGFVIDASGIVITNNHVIKDADEIFVIFHDGTKLKAELVGKDSKTDVAVLRVKPTKPLKAVKFGDSEKLRIGDWVIAIGNPFGLGGTVTTGIVSARNRNINSGPYDNYIQTDASINKGNSGGPLFNLDGEVIGINTAIFSTSGGSIGIGFAVPSSIAIPVVGQLKEFGETRRGWLGVRIQGVTDDIAESLALKSTLGALVAGIDPNGPAKTSGFEVGDIIIGFDGKTIKDPRDLSKTVADTPVEKSVDVVVLRKGKEMTLKVKLGRLEEGEKLAEKSAQGNSDTNAPSQNVLGLSLTPLNDAMRKQYKIAPKVTRGVVVTNVEANSAAAEKGVEAGFVIIEINQEAVNTPAEVSNRIEDLKKAGRGSALFLFINSKGDVRFVPLKISK